MKGEEEIADDFGGVMCDILSAFWDEFNKGHACGDIEMIPCIRHDFGYDEWRAVARVIVKGYRELRCYPIRLNKAFMISCVFGEHAVSDETFLQSFFNYIPLDERQIVKESLIKENISVDGDDSELLDILSNYLTRRVPCTGTQLKKLPLEIAHKEIIQALSYIRESWESIFLYTKFVEKLSDFEDLYEFLRPTNKKVINLLSANPKTSAESTSLGYLQKYIRMLRHEDIKTFLRFCTRADVLCVKQIKVSFSKLYRIERRLVAHTCGPLLEVPTNYEDFQSRTP